MEQRVLPSVFLRRDPTLYNLIQKEQWKDAWDLVAQDPTAPYNGKSVLLPVNGGVRFPLQQLCRMVEFVNDHDVEDDELSDDGDSMCTDKEQQRKRNEEIYELARFMILQSQSIDTPVVDSVEGRDGVTRLSQHKSILTLPEANGNIALHVLCLESADTTMMKLLLECAPQEMMDEPLLVTQARAMDLIRIRNDHQCTPVHFVVENADCPFSALKLMVEYCAMPDTLDPSRPDPRLDGDEDGDVPLHWAFAVGLSPRRLDILLLGCHDALLVHNNKGKLPLQEYVYHHCQKFNRRPRDQKLARWNDIQALLKVVTGSQDSETWSPLHAIASGINFIPESIWTIALTFESDRRGAYDQDGLLPLHAAISTPPLDITNQVYYSMLRKIMYSYPEATRMPTSRGRMALHLAIEARQVPSVISGLLREAPQALLAVDPVTGLPPFMLAAVDDTNTLTAVYELLHKDPSILLARGGRRSLRHSVTM